MVSCRVDAVSYRVAMTLTAVELITTILSQLLRVLFDSTSAWGKIGIHGTSHYTLMKASNRQSTTSRLG